MEADAGAHIEFCIGVVDRVEAPEERKAVIEAVPPVLPTVEEEKGKEPGGPGGKGQQMQDAEMVGMGKGGDGKESEGEREREPRVESCESEVGTKVGEAPGSRGEHGREGFGGPEKGKGEGGREIAGIHGASR